MKTELIEVGAITARAHGLFLSMIHIQGILGIVSQDDIHDFYCNSV